MISSMAEPNWVKLSGIILGILVEEFFKKLINKKKVQFSKSHVGFVKDGRKEEKLHTHSGVLLINCLLVP